jgi:transposase
MDVPKGEEFLPGYTLEDLTTLYRKEGLTYWEIGWRIKYSSMTVKDWLHRMHKEGIHRRYNKKKPGRLKKINK